MLQPYPLGYVFLVLKVCFRSILRHFGMNMLLAGISKFVTWVSKNITDKMKQKKVSTQS